MLKKNTLSVTCKSDSIEVLKHDSIEKARQFLLSSSQDDNVLPLAIIHNGTAYFDSVHIAGQSLEELAEQKKAMLVESNIDFERVVQINFDRPFYQTRSIMMTKTGVMTMNDHDSLNKASIYLRKNSRSGIHIPVVIFWDNMALINDDFLCIPELIELRDRMHQLIDDSGIEFEKQEYCDFNLF